MYLAIVVYGGEINLGGVFDVVGIYDDIELAKRECSNRHADWINAPMLTWEGKPFGNGYRADTKVVEQKTFYDITEFPLNPHYETSAFKRTALNEFASLPVEQG